jgi:chromate transporter
MNDKPIRKRELFFLFFRIGAFTLGGGLAMVGVMRHELVEAKKLLTEEEFSDQFSLATSVPGAIAVNMGYILGLRFGGVFGAMLSILGVVLPSFLVIIGIVLLLGGSIENPLVGKFFRGASAAVAAQITFSTLMFAKTIRKDIISIIVALSAFVILFLTGVHPIAIIAGSLLIRLLLPFREKKR